jgi:rhombotail lipoprotein
MRLVPYGKFKREARVSKWLLLYLVTAAVGLSGCANLGCVGSCGSHAHNSSSLVEFLYPSGVTPRQDAIPQLRIPLRVGLAFLPSNGLDATGGLDAAHKEQLLERIQQRFSSRRFVTEIVVIPDYYLAGRRGFEGLAGVQRLYGVDLMALVSYDQVTHQDENYWSLGYLTIVGAYVLKGSRHDVSTLVDLAVVDPGTRSLVLRAGGTDTRHGATTLIDSDRDARDAATAGYGAATDQMIEHFDAALTKFEADVRSGKAAVQVVRKNDSGHSGGGGALGWPILALLMLVTFRRCGGFEGMAQ